MSNANYFKYKTSARLFLLVLIFITPVAFAAVKLKYHISGISGVYLNNINAKLESRINEAKKPLTAKKVQKIYSHAAKDIKNALKPFGFFQAQINGKLTQSGDKWNAYIKVTPGRAIKFGNIDIQIIGSNSQQPYFRDIVKAANFKKGQSLNIPRYQKIQADLINAANEQGFIEAKFIEHSILVYPEQYRADLTLQFDAGQRYYFGDINFDQSMMKEKFLRRYISFKAGDNFSSNKLSALQQVLSQAGYFDKVEVTPQMQQTKNYRIPILITLTPSKARRYTAGIGYGTDTGPRATLGWQWNRVNKTGDKFSTLVYASSVASTAQADYTIPGENPATDNYVLSAAAQKYDYSTGKGDLALFKISHVENFGLWQRTLALNFQTERSALQGEPFDQSNLLMPNIGWIYVKKDDPLFPMHGKKLSISFAGSLQDVGSTTSFVQGTINAKYIRPLFEDNRLVLRGDFGIAAIKDFDDFPLSLKYFAGGTQSIRSYGYQEIGPGRYLTVASAEYQYPVFDKWYLLGFCDVGNASNHFLSEFDVGAGGGFMWASPLGPMKLTIGQAYKYPSHPIRIQFSMGPEI